MPAIEDGTAQGRDRMHGIGLWTRNQVISKNQSMHGQLN